MARIGWGLILDSQLLFFAANRSRCYAFDSRLLSRISMTALRTVTTMTMIFSALSMLVLFLRFVAIHAISTYGIVRNWLRADFWFAVTVLRCELVALLRFRLSAAFENLYGSPENRNDNHDDLECVVHFGLIKVLLLFTLSQPTE